MRRLLTMVLVMIGLALPAALSAQEVKSSGKGTVGDEVVIGSFTIAFYHVKKDKMRTFDGGAKSMEVSLTGLTQEHLQAVTNIAYEDFLSALRNEGITVRDRAGFVAALEAGAKGFKGKGYQTETGHEVKSYFGRKKAEGKVLLFSPEALGAPVVNREQGGMAGMFSGLKMMKIMPRALNFEAVSKQYSKDNGVAIINPIYFIDFADFDKYEGKYVRTVEAQSSLALTAKQSGVEQTGVQFYGANGKTGRISLAEPVAVSGGFGRVAKGGGVPLGRLMGLSTKSKYTFTADVKSWGDGIAELIVAGSTSLSKALAAR